MVADSLDQPGASDGHVLDFQAEEYPVKQRNYDGFLVILKRSTIAVVIIAAIVVFIIAT